jgi:Zn-dependent M32 family carboxypeptidase
MFEQINSQVLAFGKNFADAAFKAQTVALESFEKIADIQLKTLENRVNATQAFWTEALEARNFEGFKAVWPKGVQVARENVERAVSTGQEVFGRTLKTNEAVGQIAKGQFESATAQAKAEVEKVTTAATKATVAKRR